MAENKPIPIFVPATRRFLRRSDVLAMLGCSRSNLYKMIKEGRFPADVPVYGNKVGWLESEVNAWIDDRLRERDQRQKAS